MAGIGVKLNRIFQKRSIAAYLAGFAYSSVSTVTPIFAVIANILLMGYALGFDRLGYAERELFSCTVLYIFVFALLVTAPFNSVLSRYVADAIYEERFEDILPCYDLGLLLNVALGSLIGIPFCLRAHAVGGIGALYTFPGFCGFAALVMVFYSMTWLSITKDYQKASLFFLIGMIWAFFCSVCLRYLAGWGIRESMLFALMSGFFLIAFLEFGLVRRYFTGNSSRYRPVLRYFRRYWKLAAANFLYTLGLYVHNFVFWMTEKRLVVADTFVCFQPYDMASCLAMFTNLSATIIFISRVEMHFHEKYKDYTEAVIGGKGTDIDSARREMFRQLSAELMDLGRIQFVITASLYLMAVVCLPQLGISNLTMWIYPCLTAGYFIIFLMYSVIIYLYYFNDLTGAALTALVFCVATLAGTVPASRLSELWYGIGVVAGAFAGWATAYFRLRFIERHLDEQIFCQSTLLEQGKGEKPPARVYQREKKEE